MFELYSQIFNWITKTIPQDLLNILLVIILLPIGLEFIKMVIRLIQKQHMCKKIHGLANATIEMTPKQFIAMRKKSFGGKGRPSYANQHDFTGVYVLYNKTKDLYYVGQAKSVFSRVNNHFTGHGNGDVYADYKYGDQWTIQMLQLDGSGYSSLNELERHAINVFNAHKRGYNKTKGNKN